MSFNIGNILAYTCKYVCIFNLQGWAPLHYAAHGGNTQVVGLLVAKGRDPNYRDNNVSTNYSRS